MLFDTNKLPLDANLDSNPLLKMLIMQVYVLLTMHKIDFLQIFSEIFNSPSKFGNLPLPSMPYDDDFEVLNDFKKVNAESLKFFECKNGHFYSVGECTKPVVQARCPTCNEIIGMNSNNAAARNLVEKSQVGYCIEESESVIALSTRNMGILNTTLVRLLLDSTLYLSSVKNKREALNIIKNSAKVNETNISAYFADQIRKDIDILSKCLKHSADDSLLFVQFLLHQFRTVKIQKSKLSLNKKEDRNNYEKVLCEAIQAGIGNQSTDKLIQQLTNVLANDANNSGSDQLFRIAYDLIEPNSTQTVDNGFFGDKKYWPYRKQINVESMINSFNTNSQNKEKMALLGEFIAKINSLEALKYLPNICKMLKCLYTTFNRQIDKQTAFSNTVANLIKNNLNLSNDYNFNETMISGVKSFLSAWKISCQFMDTKLNKHLSKNMLIKNEDDFESIPIAFLLSNLSNNGVYIYSLLHYLINLHNEFVAFYLKANFMARNPKNNKTNELMDKMINEHAKIDIDCLTSNDCINFSIEKDILNMVYMFSNYSLENAQETNIEYDFNKIQRAIESKLLVDKPFINIKVKLFLQKKNENFFKLK